MKKRLPLLAIAGLIAGAALGLMFVTSSANRPAQQGSTVTGKALIGGPFTLTDQAGRRVTEKDFLGRYMLIFFGYTHCPDICPSALQVMAAALDKLGDKAKEITPVFVTLDPERDTPAKMADYVKSFDQRIVGLTGSKEEVASAAKAYRVYYQLGQPDKQTGDYAVDHAAIIYLMGKDGQFVTHIPHTTNVDQVVNTISKALDAS